MHPDHNSALALFFLSSTSPSAPYPFCPQSSQVQWSRQTDPAGGECQPRAPQVQPPLLAWLLLTPPSVGEAVAYDTSRLLAQLALSPHHVSLEWLVESMRRGRPVHEQEYPFPPVAGARSQETLLPPAPPPTTDETASFEAGLLAQYGGKEAASNQTSTMMTENMSQVPTVMPHNLPLVCDP